MSVKQVDYAIINQPHQKNLTNGNHNSLQPSTALLNSTNQLSSEGVNQIKHPDSSSLDFNRLQGAHKENLQRLKIDSDVTTHEITSAPLTDGTARSDSPSLDQPTSELPNSTPGQLLSAQVVNKIPDWYKIGWAAQIDSVDLSKVEPDESKHLDLLETFLSDVYYGSWFHNAAVIFFAVAATHYITLFGGGWSSLIIILSICATYYSTSIRRLRKNVRGDLARDLARQRLFQDHETVDWLNNFLNRFWLIYEPVLSATIVASVDQILVASTPSFLESIRMSTFTLGSKAPRVDFIRSHPETETDVVVMDWKFDFTPHDILDMPSKLAASKVNPKIVLTIRFGKGVIGAAKDIVVENISFTGTIRIRIKLMNNFPHLQLIDLSFLEKPEFDFTLKPIGFDLNMIPGLSGFIESQVHATLGPMMYDPNVFTLNLEQLLAGALVDSAIGVLQITVLNAQGLRATKIGGGTPDPYVTFAIGARLNLDRTKIKHSTQNPNWKSVHFLLIHSLNEILTMEIMDFNELRKDTSLGIASVDLQTLLAEPEQEGLAVPVIHQGKPRGEIRINMIYHPCLVPNQLESGETEPVPDTMAGVVRLVLHQAKELDYKRSGTSSLSPYGKVYMNGQQIMKTPIIKRTNCPVYEAFIEVLVSNKKDAVFTISMFDDRLGDDSKIGTVTLKLTDLLELTNGEQKLDWFPLVGAKTGKLRISASWKGITMAGAINGASAYTPPIGVLKFHFDKAEDLKNVEALTGGKSDPYVRIMRSGIVLARTHIHNHDLDPRFDEIIYVPLHSLKDSFRLEVMDYQHLTKDRSLGYIDLEVSKLVEFTKDEGINIYKSTGKHQYTEYLKQEGKKALVKGQMYFTVEFHACQPMKFRPFDAPPSDVDKMEMSEISDKQSGSEELVTPMSAITSDVALPHGKTGQIEGDSIDKVEVPVKSPQVGYDVPSPDASPSLQKVDLPKNLLKQTSIDQSFPSSQQNVDKVELKQLSKEELLSSQSGILVFNIIGGVLARKHARLEFLFDDGYWPSYSTEPAKSSHPKWDETGASFIRELDWSRCILKLNVADKDTREEVYAEYTSDLKAFLSDCLDGPHDFVLENLEGGNRSIVSIQCRYIPVPITLEPRESINNMGLLTVMLDHGKDLLAADRNGYSDPYAQFILNGQKVFKSNIQKKTLNPKWNERFEVEIPSRVNAEFHVHVYDWDRVGSGDKLGQAKIDLARLEPMNQTTAMVRLYQGEKQQGQIQIRMIFRPHFISRSRQATSTFTGGFGRVATGLGGTVLSAGAGVGIGAAKGVGTVGGGVLKGVGGVGKLGYAGIKRATGIGNKRGSVIDEEVLKTPTAELNQNYSAALTQEPKTLMTPLGSPAQITTKSPPNLPDGSPSRAILSNIDYKLNIAIISATGLDDHSNIKAYIHVKRNGKSVYDTKVIRQSSTPEWNEVCTLDVKLGVESELEFILFDKRKLGKDREMGTLNIKLWEMIHPEQGQFEIELNETLETAGVDSTANNGTEGMLQFKCKLFILDVNSSISLGKEIYANSKSNDSGGHSFGGIFHHHRNHSSPAKEPHRTISGAVGAVGCGSIDGNNNINTADGFLNHDPNPTNNKPASIFGGKSQKSLGAARFSLHRLH